MILIFTGITLAIFNILDFSQPKEVKNSDTRVLSLIQVTLYIETRCRYF